MTVLLSVGEGADAPDVVSKLLDIDNYPNKPGYKLSAPEPLVLSHCEYVPCPFGDNAPQNYHSSPFNIFSDALEESLSQISLYRVGLNEAMPHDQNHFFPNKLAKLSHRSILEIQKAKSLDEKIEGLHGSKKARHENVKEWKRKMYEKEGDLFRTRSRSKEKYEDIDASRRENPAKDGLKGDTKDGQEDVNSSKKDQSKLPYELVHPKHKQMRNFQEGGDLE